MAGTHPEVPWRDGGGLQAKGPWVSEKANIYAIGHGTAAAPMIDQELHQWISWPRGCRALWIHGFGSTHMSVITSGGSCFAALASTIDGH